MNNLLQKYQQKVLKLLNDEQRITTFNLKSQTDRLNQQTKTKPQETLEFKMNKQMETFSSNHTINLPEEGKRLLAVISFEATNSVFS